MLLSFFQILFSPECVCSCAVKIFSNKPTLGDGGGEGQCGRFILAVDGS